MQFIHETILKDIIDVAKDVKGSDEIQRISNKQNGISFKSISSKSEALTMVFPVACSKNASYEAAAIVTKAIERKAVSMLHMLFTACQITDAKDGADYISRFHTNLNPGKMTVDDFMDALDGFVEENGLMENATMSDREAIKTIMEDMKSMNMYFEKDVNEVAISDYSVRTVNERTFITNNYEPVQVQEAIIPSYPLAPPVSPNDARYWKPDPANANQNMFDQDAYDIDANGINNWNKTQHTAQQMDIAAAEYRDGLAAAQTKAERDAVEDEYKRQQDAIKNNFERDKIAATRFRDDINAQKQISDIQKVAKDIAMNRLVDQDVKKANELVPTLMHVNFVSINDDSKYPITTSVIVGVKAKLYAINGNDIMNRLKVKNSDKNLMLNLVKASTREISFFKDFVLAIDKAKIDAISQSRKGSSAKMWKVLERRAVKSKIRRLLSMKNDATAITTLCVTQDEVDFLKKTAFIDIENVKTIRPIMEAYNLMGFVIIDETLEICKFMFDTGDDQYEVITFNNLEKEQKDNTKKIVNLMSKMK